MVSIAQLKTVKPLSEIARNYRTMVVGGSKHALGVFGNSAGEAAMPSRGYSASNRLKNKAALCRHLLHVRVPVRRRGPFNG
jgi:hypothetical protein